jgi:hypothetical protein
LSFNRRFGGYIASIFRVGEINSAKTSKQAGGKRRIPEDDTLHNHRCENLKSYKSIKTNA